MDERFTLPNKEYCIFVYVDMCVKGVCTVCEDRWDQQGHLHEGDVRHHQGAVSRSSSDRQSLFWSEISYNKPPPPLPGLAYLIAQSRKKTWDIEFQKCFW